MKRKRTASIWPAFRHFLPFLWPHWTKLLLTLVVVVLTAGLPIVFPRLIGVIIDLLAQHAAPAAIIVPISVFAIVLAARIVLSICRNHLIQQVAMRTACDVRIRLFEHLQTLSLRFYETSQTGRIVSRITEDADTINGLVSVAVVNLAGDSIGILGVLVVLFWINSTLASLAMLLLPLFFLNYIWHRRRLRVESRRHRHNWDRVVGFLHERLSNTRVVKAFATEDKEIELFRWRIERDYLNFNQIVMRHSLLGIGAELLSGLGTLLILVYGAYLFNRHDGFTLGNLVAFYAYLPLLYAPIVRMVDASAIVQRAATAIEKVSALLEIKPHVPDNDRMPAMPCINGGIEFRHVSFEYRSGKEVLREVSFTTEPGELVAIVGPSGAGKSTVVSLLMRFYDPTRGKVLVDGRDIRAFNVQTLRKQIGIVLQDNLLFSDSIANNIKYGCPDATDAEVIAAAKAANADEFIRQFELGYGTQIGERGVQLSGGQRQRIAIARVILKNPRILIFDEATSALDTHSEKLVQQATAPLMKGRTSLVIAHRLSTVINASRILVISRGQIIDQGSHWNLLARPGLYRELYEMQFFLPEPEGRKNHRHATTEREQGKLALFVCESPK